MKWMLCLTTLALCSSLWAEPQQWNDAGVAVALSRPVDEVTSATNDEGYTLDVWHQSQGGVPVVLGQLIGPDGSLLWEADGRILAQGLQRAGYPLVTAVNGGWVIAWLDAEYIEWCDRLDGGWCIRSALRATKINESGTPQWAGGLAGVEILPASDWWDVHPFQLFSSGDGAILSWQINYGDPVYARGISGAGVLWPAAMPVTGNLWGAYYKAISDDFGGVLVGWRRSWEVDTVVHVNRVLPDGELAWGDSAGMIAVNPGDTVIAHTFTADGMGGMYIGWSTSPNAADFRVQHINAQGEFSWPAAGIEVCPSEDGMLTQSFTTLYNNGTPDGLCVLIQSGQQLYRLQKLSLTGERMWGECGLPLCVPQAGTYYEHLALSTDQQGGAMLFIEANLFEEETYHHKMLISRVSANGTLAWTPGCVIAASETDDANTIYPAEAAGNSVRLQWYANYGHVAMYAHSVNFETGAVPPTDPIIIVESQYLTQTNPIATNLVNGSTVIVWSNNNSWPPVPYFQINDVFGEALLEENGRPLLLTDDNEPQASELYGICADGNGGFFAAARTLDVAIEQIRFLHFDGSGACLTEPQGSLVFEAATGFWTSMRPLMVADGNGGCFVSVTKFDNNSWAATSVTMRVDGQGELMWDEPVTFETPGQDVHAVYLAPGNDHSCVAVYAEHLEYPRYSLNATMISATGEMTGSVRLSDSADYPPNRVSGCIDPQGGFYLAWVENAVNEDRLIAQHVAANGERLWSYQGIEIASTQIAFEYVTCGNDGLGNLTIVWSDYTDAGYDLYAQRITPDGEVRWGDGGMVVSDAPYDQNNPKLSVISDNEIYIVWDDMRNNESYWFGRQIYATHLNARGEVGDDSWWVEGGNAICETGYFQDSPAVAADGAGGLLVAWTDQRTGFGYMGASIFAQRLFDPIYSDADETPGLPVEFNLSQNYPNPFNPETVIEFALPTSGMATLRVYDVTGREVATLLDESLRAGVHRVNFDARVLASGVYFYTLRAMDRSLARKMVVLK